MFIPLFLGVGPTAGFFIGVYLARKYSLGPWVLFTAVTIGLVAGLFETIRVIKFIVKQG